MNDLISRQELLKSIERINVKGNVLDDDWIYRFIQEFPSAQTVDKDINVPINDIISRQAAIKAICEDGTWLESQGCTEITMAERKQRDADILGELPSAEPDVPDTNVGDLISRQAARDALCDNCDNVQAVCAHYPCKQYIAVEKLPSAQPIMHDASDDADYISRETMKDAIDSTTWYHQNRNKDIVEGASVKSAAWFKAEDVYKAIENVSSAQQEITEKQVKEYCEKRCLIVLSSDAFHRLKSGRPERCEDCVNFNKARLLIPQPERKEGKWIYLNGLDAFECSVCGRQMVRNIFDYCPWCGAEMTKGEEDE